MKFSVLPCSVKINEPWEGPGAHWSARPSSAGMCSPCVCLSTWLLAWPLRSSHHSSGLAARRRVWHGQSHVCRWRRTSRYPCYKLAGNWCTQFWQKGWRKNTKCVCVSVVPLCLFLDQPLLILLTLALFCHRHSHPNGFLLHLPWFVWPSRQPFPPCKGLLCCHLKRAFCSLMCAVGIVPLPPTGSLVAVLAQEKMRVWARLAEVGFSVISTLCYQLFLLKSLLEKIGWFP